MQHRLQILLVLAAALVAAGCQSGGEIQSDSPRVATDSTRIATSLDRPNWMVRESSEVWRVLISDPVEALAPEHVGYLVRNHYRRGGRGPSFEMYTVTSLNRDEQLGHIDAVGRAVRYEPVRNGTFDSVDVGTGTLEHSVGAIFDTLNPVRLERTTERKIAFRHLDRDGSGALEADEYDSLGRGIAASDANGNGKIEPDEFERADL